MRAYDDIFKYLSGFQWDYSMIWLLHTLKPSSTSFHSCFFFVVGHLFLKFFWKCYVQWWDENTLVFIGQWTGLVSAVSLLKSNDFSFHWAHRCFFCCTKTCFVFHEIRKLFSKTQLDWRLRPLPMLGFWKRSPRYNGTGATFKSVAYPDRWFFSIIWSWKHLIHFHCIQNSLDLN